MTTVWGEDGAEAVASEDFAAVLGLDMVVDFFGVLQQVKCYCRDFRLEAAYQTLSRSWLFSVLRYLDIGYEDSRICGSV